jgi:multiple sugar transport system substrate-binding protein
MKKSILIFTIAVLISLVAAGSHVFAAGKTESGTADKPVTIQFWKAPHTDEGEESAYWEAILDQFMDEYPNITVEHLITPWGSWIEKYTAAFAAGTPPDVAYMTEWYPRFADTGQLENLEPRIDKDMENRYGQGMWDYATWNGNIIGIPFIAGTQVVYYNKTILEEEGIDIPETWSEFQSAAKKATKDLDGDGKVDQWGTIFKLTPQIDFHQFAPSVYQAGASYLNDDQTALGFANDEGILSVEYITSFVREGSAPPMDMFDGEQMNNQIYQGNVAMWIDQHQSYMRILENSPDMELGAFLMPAGPADDPQFKRACYGGIGLLSIATDSKYKDAAWTFIEFLTQPEIESQYYSKVGFLAPNPETNDLMYPDNPYIAVASEATKYMVAYPLHEKWPEISTLMKTMYEEVLRGVKTPEKAVMDANAEAGDILD